MDHETQRERSFVHSPFVLGLIGSVLGTLGTIAVVHEYAPRMLAAPTPVDSSTLGESAATPMTTASIPDVVARATPSVVSVVVSADVPVIERYFEEYDPFGGFFGGFGFSIPRERQIGTERQTIGGGTGFFVSGDGYIVTNRHVVDQDNVAFSIVTNEGDTYPVEVIAKDSLLDVAVLRVTDVPGNFPALTFGDSEALRLGESVIAIGNALAEFPNSVSVGVVSGLSRNIVARDAFGSAEALDGVIQTDAAINPGNSGGPLLNVRGEVIGVNVAVANGSENIGFSIPGNVVRSVVEGVREHGEIVRPFIGVRYMDITTEVAKENGLPVDYGILVVRGEQRAELAVIPGSPADKAGIEENDIILSVDGVKLDGEVNFARKIREYAVGDTITLTVLHDGAEREVRVTLEQAPTE